MLKAVPAVYCDGDIHFAFQKPEYDGPISVMIVFPDYEEYHADPNDYFPENPDELCILPPR